MEKSLQRFLSDQLWYLSTDSIRAKWIFTRTESGLINLTKKQVIINFLPSFLLDSKLTQVHYRWKRQSIGIPSLMEGKETRLYILITHIKKSWLCFFSSAGGWGGRGWITHKRPLRMPINLRPEIHVWHLVNEVSLMWSISFLFSFN